VKKVILFSAWAVLFTGIQLLTNCSKPLESIDENDQIPGDTVTDTIVVFDTVAVFDTVVVIDTVVVVDTISVADTAFCARLNSHRKEIVWMIGNDEGLYSLEFSAISERENHSRTLVISIDDQQFFWHLSEYSEFIADQNLEQNAIVRIESIPPPSYGHAIDICLRVRAL
jgi:hypothetical protein